MFLTILDTKIHLKYIYLLALFIIVGWISFLYRPVKITNHYPQKLMDSYKGKIEIYFNKPIKIEDAAITVDPAVAGFTALSEDNTLFSFTPTQEYGFDKSYTVAVSYRGKELLVFSFTTPPASTDTQILKQNAESVTQNYPFAYFLPYKSINYTIKYSAPLTLKIIYNYERPDEQEIVDLLKEESEKNDVTDVEHTYIFEEKTNSN